MATKDNSSTNSNLDLKKLADLIKDIRVAMLTTVDPDGNVRTRPMASQAIDFDGSLWFFTGRHTGKVQSIESYQQVNIAYASPTDSKFVSIMGWAEVINDPIKAAELWNPVYRAWFPNGLEDPELTLIKVHVEEAEYWDSPNGKMVQLIGMAKAALTGEPYRASQDEHGKVELPH